jgi:hypothetical protein
VWTNSDRVSATERDLAALADGSIDAARRELVERLVAASAELQTRLREQRRAVSAVRSVAVDRAPLALRVSSGTVPAGPRSRARWLGPALAGVLAVVGCVLALVGGGAAGPTVLQAAAVAERPAIVPVREPRDGAVALPRLRAAGLPFPYWEDRFGWTATGARTDTSGGRLLTTVFYRRAGRTIVYTIVSGAPLRTGSLGHATVRGRTRLLSFDAGGRRIVTWLRRGHTCVLSGVNVPTRTLLTLASWRGRGELPY